MSGKVVLFLFLFLAGTSFGQKSELSNQIDSLLNTGTAAPFNGVILITQQGKTLYEKCFGVSDYDKQSYFKLNDQFVIGSISKQITAVLILREYDKGRLKIHTPIRLYLPDLKQQWADTVTIHHLLTHTHGITELNQPLQFPAGTQFQYSQVGYALLAEILEVVTGKTFAMISTELFQKCKMKSTCHPLNGYRRLVKGYTENVFGKLIEEDNSFENFVPAGGFISTASDLIKWNKCLHEGKLLSDSTYQLMIKKYATREHPIFGPTEYGYGISVGEPDGVVQLGQTGYAPGFISMDFYFPESKTSLIILDNMVWDPEHIKNTFYYHTSILKMLRGQLKNSAQPY